MKPSFLVTAALLGTACVALPSLAWTAEVPQYQYIDLGDVPQPVELILPVRINNSAQVAGNLTDEFADGAEVFRYANGVLRSLTDITPMPSGFVSDMNDRGDITGVMCSTHFCPQPRGYYYSNGTAVDIGELEPEGWVIPTAMNAAGQITGLATIDHDSTRHAFLYDPATGVLKNLGSPNGSYSEGLAINAAGVVAANVRNKAGRKAFVYDHGVSTILTPNTSSFVAGTQTINDEGYVTGNYVVGGFTHAFIWHKGKLTDLGTLGGTSSSSYWINEARQVLGTSLTKTGESHLFLYDGKMKDIDILVTGFPGAHITNAALNALGNVAITFEHAGGGQRAAVYKKGQILLLRPERLLKPGDPVGVGGSTATAINDFGQVAGSYKDSTRAFIATPISLLFQRLWDATVNFAGVRTTEGAAWTAYAKYDVATSDAQLAKFIRDVNTLVAQKKLSTTLGNKWVADAQAIRAAMKG